MPLFRANRVKIAELQNKSGVKGLWKSCKKIELIRADRKHPMTEI